MLKTPGRNDPCICGSGKKYKKCCINKGFQTFQYRNEYDRLIKDFISYMIPFDTPGFYKHPNFIAQKSRNPKFLEEYAKFVRDQPYTEEYIELARTEIPRICTMLHAELVKDGAKGKCLQMTSLLCKALELEGFWNYSVRGALTITHSSKRPTHFRPVGIDDNWAGGHTWVVAPPFTVLDLTVNQQYYENGESRYLPDYVISESLNTADVLVDDILRKDSFKGNPRARIADVNTKIIHFIQNFHPRKIDHKATSLKYSAVEIIPQIEYEFVNNTFQLNGRNVQEVYDEVIKKRKLTESDQFLTPLDDMNLIR